MKFHIDYILCLYNILKFTLLFEIEMTEEKTETEASKTEEVSIPVDKKEEK